MKDIRLYIAGKLVECDENISLPITYQLEDFKNPTIIKNSFSKSISVPGTKNNNKLFDEMFRLDRKQHLNQFNPSKREDFRIYKNGELVESGYMQLNNITGYGKDLRYDITLYGGLGGFFYGLKYNEDGTGKTLADLRYFITENGVVLPKETEMDFIINKEFVWSCFNREWDRNINELNDVITFIPCYNGLYQEFSNDKCLINTLNDDIFAKKLIDNKIEYTPKNGFGLANLNESYTEWEMRDLRSYQQRPAIKVSKLIETICRKENSGYDVIFDGEFFSEKNPYWSKSFIMLPLLASKDSAQTIKKGDLSSLPLKVGDVFGNIINESKTNIDSNGVISSVSGLIDLSGIPSLADIDLSYDLSLNLFCDETRDIIYPATVVTRGEDMYVTGSSVTAQLVIYDEKDNILGHSDLYNFTKDYFPGTNETDLKCPGEDTWYGYIPFIKDTNVKTISGEYRRTGNKYTFKSGESDVFRVEIPNWKKTVNKIRVELIIKSECTEAVGLDYVLDSGVEKYFIKNEVEYADINKNAISWRVETERINGYINAEWEGVIFSNEKITKKKLLKTEQSPADFLLSYAKLFGLYFVKDVDEKIIRIYNRNSFFTGKTVDLSDKLDYSKDMTISPLLFDKKWYTLCLDTPETFFSTKYKDLYDLTYGQQRLNTGYNFNSENRDLYSENIYQNVVSGVNSNKYYRIFRNYKDKVVPCFLNDNCEYKLFNKDKEYGTDMFGYYEVDPSRTKDWNNIAGADLFAKPCCFNKDKDIEDIEEIEYALVLYDGQIDLKDKEGNYVYYWLSDDIDEMYALNDKEPCFLYTNDEYDVNGNRIAIKLDKLPKYGLYRTNNNSVEASLDFGLPKQIFIKNVSYNEKSTIYYNFWKKFYNDQFSVDTKKFTCYVKLDKASVEDLRNFYWFKSSWWILNKIDSFDISSCNTVRCEFIKVQDLSNYKSGVTGYPVYIKVNDSLVDYNTTEVKELFDFSDKWRLGSGDAEFISPEEGLGGKREITIKIPINTTYGLEMYKQDFYLVDYAAIRSDYKIIQKPNPENTIKISGEIFNIKPDYRIRTQIDIDKPSWISTEGIIENGSYYIYTKKNTRFTLEVTDKDGHTLWEKVIEPLSSDLIENIAL